MLLAMGMSEEQAHSSIRIGCGRFNTENEISMAAEHICKAVGSLKRIVVATMIRSPGQKNCKFL